MEQPPGKLPPKKDVLDSFLKNGSARLFIDPRREGAVVPAWFAKQPELVLRVGYSLSPPIPDLLVTAEAVSCTLSFNRSPFWCKMPWSVIFAVVSDVNGRGVVWPEDVPLESQLLKPQRTKPQLARTLDRPAGKGVQQELPLDPPQSEEGSERRGSRASKGKIDARRQEAVTKPNAADQADETRTGSESNEPQEAGKARRKLPPYLRVVK
jgi:stringent starvation protein B